MSKTKEKILLSAYEKSKGHRRRVKERFLKEGAERFADEDILELLLMLSIPYKDTRKLARELLTHFKTLDHVIDAPVEELSKFKGLKERSILPLKVVKEVAKRYLKAKALKAEYIRSPQSVYDYLKYELQSLSREVLKAIYLDAKSKILGIETLFEGTITESAIYPREIFAKAFEKRAVSLILVHNHPSGDPTPSKADIQITKNLILAGYLLGCKVVDHVIIGKDGYFSMAEAGIINNLEKEIVEIL